jgi:hypothetical protein
MSLATVSLSINDVETMKKPTHIIMWQDDNVSSLVTSLTARVEALEKLLSKEFRTPLISGIDMKRRSDSLDCLSAVLPTANAASVFQELLSVPLDLKVINIAPRMGQDSIMYSDSANNMPSSVASGATDEDADAEAEEEAEADADAEAEAEADADADADAEEEADAEAEADDVEEEDEAEEEALELEEFEYKGVTYYRDSELQVYQLDTDGDLDETAIGVWNESKQKVLKYAKAT